MSFSNTTLAELSRALTSVVGTHAELDNLFLQYGLSDRDVLGGIAPRSNALVRYTSRLDPPNNERALADLIRYVLERGNGGLINHPAVRQHIERLTHSLRTDGFEWRDGNLIPTTPEPGGLAREISALERDLDEIGLNVAAAHYRQAHESFVAGNWEAANGQTRSFLENLFIELGVRITSTTRDTPDAALQDIRNNGFIDASEFQMLKGFWSSIQDNGPHHGLSDEQEALFRLHVATSVARYALHRLRAS